MKKYLVSVLTVLFVLVFLLPHNMASAAEGKATLKSYKYKGQPYVQVVNHPNKSAAAKMNKELKAHAVRAASIANSKEYKQNKDYYYKTSVTTAYNNKNALSIIYYTSAYTGAAHDMQWSETFNYTYSNGKRIYMKDFLDSRTKIARANLYLRSVFEQRNKDNPGSILDEKKILDIQKGNFFCNDNGFTVTFDPYEVAAFSEGFVEVFIPSDFIVNGPSNAQTTSPAQTTNTIVGVKSSEISVYSNDLKTYLGNLSTNTFDTNSIFNAYGTYGSQYSVSSIWNEYSNFGSSYSIESAFNPYTVTPPVLVYEGQAFAYLSTNKYLANVISPASIYEYAKSLK